MVLDKGGYHDKSQHREGADGQEVHGNSFGRVEYNCGACCG